MPNLSGTPTTAIGPGTGTITIAKPAGLVNGDYLIAFLRGQASNATSDWTLSGWSRLGPAFIASNDGRLTGFYGKPITNAPGEPADYTFTSPVGGRAVGMIAVFKNVDLTNPVAGFYNSFQGDSIASGRSTGAFGTVNPSLALYITANEATASFSSTPTSLPAGATQIGLVESSTGTSATRSVVWAGYRTISDVTVPASSATWANNAGTTLESIALRGTTVAAGYPARDGNGAVTRVFYTTNGSGAYATPEKLITMNPGFTDVTAMLAKTGFTVGHRGNSARYAEGSLRAYTQTVARGYGALEISLARTVDGVWFILHDQTLNRTSGLTGMPAANTMTWAQVQAYQITNAGDGVVAPYATWAQFKAIYGATHVLFVDPKYEQLAHRSEFFDLLDEFGPTKVVVKYSGTNTDLANYARGRGYKSWGYFYSTDLSDPNLATYIAAWDILGFDYNSSVSDWATFMTAAGSKPVMGHVIPTQAGYDYVIARGAKGAMISGSNAVKAVGPY